jgi:hypothetical protein
MYGGGDNSCLARCQFSACQSCFVTQEASGAERTQQLASTTDNDRITYKATPTKLLNATNQSAGFEEVEVDFPKLPWSGFAKKGIMVDLDIRDRGSPAQVFDPVLLTVPISSKYAIDSSTAPTPDRIDRRDLSGSAHGHWWRMRSYRGEIGATYVRLFLAHR